MKRKQPPGWDSKRVKVMKDEYLWNKTGANAEIEALENALQAFSYRENAPPELPAKVFTVEKAAPRGFFRLRFAFAAFASVAAVLFVVWLQFQNANLPPRESVAEISEPKIENKVADEFIERKPEIKPAQTVQKIQPAVVKTQQRSAPKMRPVKTVLRHAKISQPVETLTAEEKYAYDQLMLALSITGSKLRIVKDKIDRMEE